MRYVHIDSVEPGQFLGKTIFSGNGVVLLSEGVQLTVYMITQLRRIGVTMLYIKDPNFDDVEIADLLSQETKQAVMRQMGEVFEAIRSGKELSAKNINFKIDQLLEEITKNKEVLVQLTDIRTKDNDLYVHSLNVCMMATLIGVNLGLTQAQLKELAIGAHAPPSIAHLPAGAAAALCAVAPRTDPSHRLCTNRLKRPHLGPVSSQWAPDGCRRSNFARFRGDPGRFPLILSVHRPPTETVRRQ